MITVDTDIVNKLPERISRLYELAYDLWWSWNKEAIELWEQLDRPLWHKTSQNPVLMLRKISFERLEQVSQDPGFLLKYDAVIQLYERAKNETDLWFGNAYPHHKNKIIAYLSTEFAVHQSIPIYSGGLGVLSGDHCKEASDLGLPLVAVGTLYSQGYFTQVIDAEGNQLSVYENIDFKNTALTPLMKSDNEEFIIKVRLGERDVFVKVWLIQVGRVKLFLLDTNLDQNSPADRELSMRLYDSDRDTRIRQEIVLGIGSVQLLRALNISPSIWHINEGHVAFSLIELLREKMLAGLTFEEAKKEVRKSVLFTTHTPVPAGHEEFSIELVKRYFNSYIEEMGINEEQFLDLGRVAPNFHVFNMTMLALNLSSIVNGVSKLNAKVMNNNLKPLWSRVYDDPPIIGITNGVHIPSWLSIEMQNLFTRYVDKDWFKKHDEPQLWEKIYDIPDRELWRVRRILKNKLLTFIRDRTRYKWSRRKINGEQAICSGLLLDPNVLTIGFARRFAPYKRATLIFRDIERLKRIVNNPYRPVQFIFAGKSHPANEEGKALIKQIYKFALDPDFAGRIVFIEDYNLNIAKFLIAGVDVWLNNPRRPLEASGTSGQKAAINGVPNFSIRDGWWDEGYNGKNGWEIGSASVNFEEQSRQDDFDARSLYNVLESEIIPLYYQKDSDGIPRRWLDVVRESIKSVIHQYSTRRMVKEYTARAYTQLMTQL